MSVTLDPPRAASAKYIERVLGILHPPGSTIEIRALGIKGKARPHTAAGYFRDFKAAGRAVVELEKQDPDGVYLVMNRLNDSLYSRSPDRITPYPKSTAGDGDVTRRHWLLIDVDPERPADISSTDEELKAAEVLAASLADWLMEKHGFHEPVEAMSGNGFHLLFPVDLPNDEASKGTIEAVLKVAHAGAEELQTGEAPRCKVDIAVSNAARITKLYGTIAGKGFSTEERPHRRSHLVHVPDHLGNWGEI